VTDTPKLLPLFQDRRTGKRVRQVGGGNDEHVLVKPNDGPPYYASRSRLIPCDETGTPDFTRTAELPGDEGPDDQVPTPLINIPETRINVNTASAEDIAQRVPGVGYRVAKRMKQIQLTQPGEAFRNLDQLRAAGSRVNWDTVFAQNLLYVG
jgi:hypothetical protein